jgi:hypothetical protein
VQLQLIVDESAKHQLNFLNVTSGKLEPSEDQAKAMKAPILLAVAAMALASTASATKYDDLVAKGYRWSTADGPYACVAKEDVHKMTSNPADSVILKMVEQVKVFYLTPGTIVQVTEEDAHTGTSKIRLAGITVDLWTLTSFLTKHPIKDTYGVIETPETSGLIPSAPAGVDAGPTPSPSFSASPAASPSPEASASPTPGSGQ